MERKWKGKKKKREKNMRMARLNSRAVERGEGWEENEGLIDR